MQILKFLVGGGSAVAVDFLVYIVLKQRLDISASKTVSYVAGAAVGFLVNKLWTFESRGFSLFEIGKYVVLYIFSACMNTLVNAAVLSFLSITVAGFLAATGTSTVVNFLGQKFVVFRKG